MINFRLSVGLGAFLTLSLCTFAQTSTQDNSSLQTPPADPSTTKSTSQPPSSKPEAGSSQLPDSPSATQKKTGQKTQEEIEIERKEQSQKILGVVPQYSVTSRHDAPPLTKSEKFHLMAKQTINPFEFVAVGLQAGISQAEDAHPGYGQGAEGYAKRYGAAYADQATSNFFSNFAYPVIFKQDPRYFRLGEGTVKHRILYSMAQEFSAVRDSDHKREFNYSNVLGAFTSGAISNVYYPQQDRGLSNTLDGSAIALVYGSVGGLLDEFWPDVRDKWAAHKKKKKDEQNQQ
jgi:hypothetical protein